MQRTLKKILDGLIILLGRRPSMGTVCSTGRRGFCHFHLLMGIFFLASLSLSVEGMGAETTNFQQVAQNTRAILWVDQATGLLQITDRATERLWRAIPASIDRQNDLWKTIYRSAFTLRFINGSNIDTMYTGQLDCTKTVTRIPSGVKIRFSFAAQPQLAFTAVYQLTEDGFRVRIPYRLINDPAKVLLDIRVLPYFGHLDFGSDGYVMVPDGIGGIIHATRRKSLRYLPSRVYGERFFWTVEKDRYNQYGSPQRYLNVYDYSDLNTMSMSLPIFGVVQGNSAFLGVIKSGQFQAQIGPEITPDDRVLSVSPQLIFRELTYDIFTRLQSGLIMNRGDRVVEYHLLADEEATYEGMARRYRGILQKKNGPMEVRRKGYRLRLLFGVEEVYKDTRNLLTLTTFSQAEQILFDLHRQGVRDLEVVLVGWTRRGLLGANPQHFPADKRFGGQTGLKRLLATGERLGYSIGLQINNTYTYKRSRGYRRSDTVKDIQNIPIDIGMGAKEYLLCPEPAWKHFMMKERRILQRLGVKGFILWDGLQQGLVGCFDDQHPCGTPEMALMMRNAAKTLSVKDSLAIGAIGTMDYLFPYSEGLFDMPSTASNFCDKSIPLLPMIYHGLMGYSFEPINLRRDQRREFLKSIEYGGIPNALLTSKTVEHLDEAYRNPVFSGEYQAWRGSVLKEYKVYKSLKALQKQAIIGHRSLAPGVFQTMYADGRFTVVNYGKKPYQIRGTEVKPMSYRLFH